MQSNTSLTLIRPTDLARELSVPISTLYRWIDEDPDFPPRVRIGPRTVGFRRQQVERWLESRTEEKEGTPK